MVEFFEMTKDWFLGLGEQYGVNPIIFGSIYVGAIPFFTFFFISAYLYLIIAGKNVPIWVYVVIVLLVMGGAYSTVQKIKRKVEEPPVQEDK